MSMLLESDRNVSTQTHMDELTRRVTMVFLTVGCVSILWYGRIDSILTDLMHHLDPCQEACLNIYEPAQWSVVRWMGAILLGSLTSMPLMAYHAYTFAQPGLMQSERRALRTWLMATVVLTIIGVVILLGTLLPWAYHAGYMHHRGIGLEAQYSAVQLLTIAGFAVTIWMTSVLVWTTTVCLGLMGWITEGTASLWRWRTYGVATLVLIASTPEAGRSMVLPTLAVIIMINEAVGHRWWTLHPTMSGTMVETFDSMGARRRMAVIDCSCEGANAFAGLMSNRSEASLRVNALCNSAVERERILQFAVVSNLTDLVVTGCDTAPCPSSFKRNLEALRCGFSGLNMMRMASHRGDPSYVHAFDLESALMLATPGLTPKMQNERCLQLGQKLKGALVALTQEQWDGSAAPILISDNEAVALLPTLGPGVQA